MLRRSLSLLLVATIFACPFFCSLSAAIARSSNGGDTPVCCGCFHPQNSADQGQHSNRSKHCPPNSGKCCQCICGGAVSELAGTQDFSVDTSWWTILPIANALLPTVCETQNHVSIAQLQPDDGLNLGRSMRCLFMSFLC